MHRSRHHPFISVRRYEDAQLLVNFATALYAAARSLGSAAHNGEGTGRNECRAEEGGQEADDGVRGEVCGEEDADFARTGAEALKSEGKAAMAAALKLAPSDAYLNMAAWVLEDPDPDPGLAWDDEAADGFGMGVGSGQDGEESREARHDAFLSAVLSSPQVEAMDERCAPWSMGPYVYRL